MEDAGVAAFPVHCTPVWADAEVENAVAESFIVIAVVICEPNLSGCPFTRRSLALVPAGKVNVACKMRSMSLGFEGSASFPRTTVQQEAANCCAFGMTLLLKSVQSGVCIYSPGGFVSVAR